MGRLRGLGELLCQAVHSDRAEGSCSGGGRQGYTSTAGCSYNGWLQEVLVGCALPSTCAGPTDNLEHHAAGWELVVEESRHGLHYWAWRRYLRKGLFMWMSRTGARAHVWCVCTCVCMLTCMRMCVQGGGGWGDRCARLKVPPRECRPWRTPTTLYVPSHVHLE